MGREHGRDGHRAQPGRARGCLLWPIAHPPRDGLAFTARLGSAAAFRRLCEGSGWLIAGQSLTGDAHTERLLLYAELIAGPFVLLAMFFGLLVGLRALLVLSSRRRQLEFTA